MWGALVLSLIGGLLGAHTAERGRLRRLGIGWQLHGGGSGDLQRGDLHRAGRADRLCRDRVGPYRRQPVYPGRFLQWRHAPASPTTARHHRRSAVQRDQPVERAGAGYCRLRQCQRHQRTTVGQRGECVQQRGGPGMEPDAERGRHIHAGQSGERAGAGCGGLRHGQRHERADLGEWGRGMRRRSRAEMDDRCK